MRKVSISPLLLAGGLAVMFALYFCTFQVRFSEVAVRVQLGRASASSVYTEPGLWFKWPPPIETGRKYDRRRRTLDTPEEEIKTRDGKNVIVGAYALWRVKDPLRYMQAAVNEEQAANLIRERLKNGRAVVVGRRDMVSFVNLDPEVSARTYDELEQEMLAEVAPRVLADYGVEIARFELRRVSLPAEATRTVFEQMRKQREIDAARYRQEGQSIADALKAKAEAAAKQIREFALRRAQEIASAGVQASTRILAQSEEADSEFFEWLRWLDATRVARQENTTIFIDADSRMFRTFSEPSVPRTPAGPTTTAPGSN